MKESAMNEESPAINKEQVSGEAEIEDEEEPVLDEDCIRAKVDAARLKEDDEYVITVMATLADQSVEYLRILLFELSGEKARDKKACEKKIDLWINADKTQRKYIFWKNEQLKEELYKLTGSRKGNSLTKSKLIEALASASTESEKESLEILD